jgi:excisionase family DNA binding protein
VQTVELLSTTETARILRVHPATLATWRHEGRGPKFVKVGDRRVRYRLSDVETWLDGQTRSSTAGR